MFSKETQALVPKVYEAIKKIAEKAGKKCLKCEGTGNEDDFGGCRWCNGTGKVKGEWEWEPERWQQVVYRGKVNLIRAVLTPIYVDLLSKRGVFIKDLIPLLHWERIEEILEGMGYALSVLKYEGYVKCYIHQKDDLLVTEQRKTRQEAVMRAVIELGKEE